VEKLNKKSKANNVKPFMVKNHLWVFINAQIENPAFDSQVRAAGHHVDHARR
jgi:DNA topoisomerase-2